LTTAKRRMCPWDARRLLGLRATEQGASAMENA
jgi:hypothetical protein